MFERERKRERKALVFVMAGVCEFMLCVGGYMGGCDWYVSNKPRVCCWGTVVVRVLSVYVCVFFVA